MRQQPKLGNRQRGKIERENFPTEGSNTQPGPLTEQRTKKISKESEPGAYSPYPRPCQGRGRHARARAGSGWGVLLQSQPETASFTRL